MASYRVIIKKKSEPCITDEGQVVPGLYFDVHEYPQPSEMEGGKLQEHDLITFLCDDLNDSEIVNVTILCKSKTEESFLSSVAFQEYRIIKPNHRKIIHHNDKAIIASLLERPPIKFPIPKWLRKFAHDNFKIKLNFADEDESLAGPIEHNISFPLTQDVPSRVLMVKGGDERLIDSSCEILLLPRCPWDDPDTPGMAIEP